MEKNKNSRTLKRKDDHIRINVEEDVQSGLTTGLEKYSLQHCALPEINLSDVSPNTSFLGYEVKLPLLISSMTGGTHESEKINIHLAQAAQATGIAMGLGSQRAAAEDPIIAETFNLRKYAPEIPVFANLGAIQLNYGFGLDERSEEASCRERV